MNFQAIKVIIFNTFQKEFRNKIFIFLFLMTLIGILSTTLISHYVFQEVVPPEAMVLLGNKTLDIIFGIVQFWTLVVAMILGSDCLRSDFKDKNIAYQLLGLPIKRIEYLLARILGTWILVCFYYFFSYFVALGSFSFIAGDFVGKSSVIIAFFYASLSSLGVVLLLSLFSFFLPKVLSFMMGFFFYFLINYLNISLRDAQAFENLSSGEVVGVIAHYLLPPLGNLGALSQDALIQLGGLGKLNPTLVVTHSLVSIVLIFTIVGIIIKRRDF